MKLHPLETPVNFLSEKKRDHYIQIQKESEELIRQYAEKTYVQTPDIIDEGFSLIASKELWQDKFAAAVKTSEASIYVIGEWTNLTAITLSNPQIYLDPLQRGLTIKLITNRTTDQQIIDLWNSQTTNRFHKLEIQLLSERPPINAMIFDSKTASMCVRSAPEIELVPSLWSDNPEFVKVLVSYFKNLWAKAKK